MKKIRTSFKEEEQNSLQFLEKLTKYKQVSKDIKKKNQLASHKIEWLKDMQKMIKQEKSLMNDIGYSTIQIDKLIGPLKLMEQFEDEKEDYKKNYFSYNETLIKQREMQEINIWYQVRNFRDIISKLKSNKKQIDYHELNELYNDIKSFLQQTNDINNHEFQILKNNTIIQMESYKLDQDAYVDDIIAGDDDEEEESDIILNNHEDNGNMDNNENNGDQSNQNEKNIKKKSSRLSKLQLLLQNQNIEEDEDNIINYLKAFQLDGQVVIQEKKLLNQYKKALGLLNERYKLEIEMLDVEYQNKGRTDPPEFFKINENYQEFKHIYKCYNMKGKERDYLMERLQIHFPKVKKLILEVMDSILQNSEYKQQKLDALYRNYLFERKELKRKAEQQIQDMLQERIEENKRNAQKLITQKEQARLQEELELRRQHFIIKKQLKLDIQKQIEEEKLIEDKKKKEIYDQRVKESKIKAIEYENQKRIKEEQIREQEEQKRMKQIYEQQQQVIKNKDRVQERQEHEYNKIEQKVHQKELQQRMKQLDQERIEQAIEGYQFRPQIEADFNRLKQPTKANIIKKQTKYDKADKIPLTQVHGYSVNQLMKDMRYKLSSALADAGLQQSEYARDVMKYLYH